MYNIQYEAVDGSHKMQSFDTPSRDKLLIHLSRFQRPIMAVYEQTTPITKWAQGALRELGGRKISVCAQKFANLNLVD